jgi:hypothetical protein
MASDRHDARGRRFTVATTKNRRLTQEQLDLFKDTAARTTEQGAPQGGKAAASALDRNEDGKAIPDPPSA